jgi:Periplasmic binding protein-like domain
VDAADDPERQLLLTRQLRDQRVDGLIVQPLDPSDERWSQLAESLPIVSIGDALHGGRAAGEVVFDNRAGVTLALEHLHKLGHRQIGVLTPTQPSTPDRPADIHVMAEAERLGLDVSIASSPPALTAATEVAREVLSKAARPTALFCFGDSIAYGAYAASRELGLRIPDDVSVCGYDDHPMSALLTPANAWRRGAGKGHAIAAPPCSRRARPGTFRERVDPCQHCGPRPDGRMRTASAATFRADRALSLPPAARFRAFYRRHAAAISKAAAAGSRGSRALCIHRLSRAQSLVLLVKTTTYPWRPVPTHGQS